MSPNNIHVIVFTYTLIYMYIKLSKQTHYKLMYMQNIFVSSVKCNIVAATFTIKRYDNTAFKCQLH